MPRLRGYPVSLRQPLGAQTRPAATFYELPPVWIGVFELPGRGHDRPQWRDLLSAYGAASPNSKWVWSRTQACLFPHRSATSRRRILDDFVQESRRIAPMEGQKVTALRTEVSLPLFTQVQPEQERICYHCKAPFTPDPRNRTRQRFCRKPECRKAQKIRSQQIWLAKHPHYFRGSASLERVRNWRRAHPGYASRAKSTSGTSSKRAPLKDPLQDSVTRNPLIIGLIADLYGCALQDSIEKRIALLIMKGMKLQLALAGSETNRREPGNSA